MQFSPMEIGKSASIAGWKLTGHNHFYISIKHKSGDVEWKVWKKNWSMGRKFTTGDTNLGVDIYNYSRDYSSFNKISYLLPL